MKTGRTTFYKSSHYYMTLFVILVLTCIGCSESASVDPDSQSQHEEYLKFRVMTEQYWVDPAGTTIVIFNGGVILEFPEGAVTEPTLFTIASFPLHCLEREGCHLMDRGFSITSESEPALLNSSLNHYVKIKMSFDSDLLSGIENRKESAISIYYLNDYGCANERINLMCKCIGDPLGNSIHGCLYCCGTYVIGES